MWALVEDNSITKTFNRPKGFTLGDVQYPASIFTLWSTSEKEAIGLYEIVVDNSNLKDEAYYMNGAESITWGSNTVTKSFATATAKNLAELKTSHKEVINSQAAGVLAPTDWMVVRAAEGGTAVPSDITTSRAAVRTKANEMCTAIDAVSDVDALAALYVYNDAEPPVRPLGELPTV
jgi:hypothetical protein